MCYYQFISTWKHRLELDTLCGALPQINGPRAPPRWEGPRKTMHDYFDYIIIRHFLHGSFKYILITCWYAICLKQSHNTENNRIKAQNYGSRPCIKSATKSFLYCKYP